MTKNKAPKLWRASVNLDRLEADTGRWRITTGKASDPLPREVANDAAVQASVVAWMTAHKAKKPPEAEVTKQLEDAIRASVTTAFQAMSPPPAAPPRS